MSEQEIVKRTASPITKEGLISDFKKMGIRQGDCLLVHTSLSKIGWVCGGPVTVIEALLESVGSDGTITMPTHTAGNTDPKNWMNPPVPESWWSTIRDAMPAFDPDKTPTLAMGTISEAFRKWPGVVRSSHPIGSFASKGRLAETLVKDHELEPMFGDSSPLGRLYELDAKILLIGVTHDTNTSLHLAEYRADFNKPYHQEGCAAIFDGKRQWVEFRMMALETDDFEKIGFDFERDKPEILGTVGSAKSLLFKQRELVDFAVNWMSKNRQ